MYTVLIMIEEKTEYFFLKFYSKHSNMMYNDCLFQSYSKLKEALRVCAAFRGTYLDYRIKADEINEKNKQEYEEKM